MFQNLYRLVVFLLLLLPWLSTWQNGKASEALFWLAVQTDTFPHWEQGTVDCLSLLLTRKQRMGIAKFSADFLPSPSLFSPRPHPRRQCHHIRGGSPLLRQWLWKHIHRFIQACASLMAQVFPKPIRLTIQVLPHKSTLFNLIPKYSTLGPIGSCLSHNAKCIHSNFNSLHNLHSFSCSKLYFFEDLKAIS